MSPLRFVENTKIGFMRDDHEVWESATVISSDSHFPVSYSAMGSLVGYTKVREYRMAAPNVDGQGYIEYQYNNHETYGRPDFVPEFPVFTNGLLASEKVMDNAGVELKSTQYSYTTFDKHRFFGMASKDYFRGQPNITMFAGSIVCGGGCYYDRFNIAFYLLASRIVRPSSIVETTQGLSVAKSFLYNSNGLPTLETQNFGSKIVNTATSYYNNTTLPDYGERYLLSNFPVQRTVSINNIQDKKEVFTFSNIGNQYYYSSGIKIPQYNITNYKSYLTTSTVPIEMNYQYNFGSVSQATSSHGPTKTYLWGYRGTRVIGEVIGMTETEVINQIGNSGLLINDAIISNYDNTESTLMSRCATLRNNLSAMATLTSFTYDILKGISTITDKNNMTSYYDYDATGRLIIVKDNDQNIVKNYIYHFK
jgi:hypothetical protein